MKLLTKSIIITLIISIVLFFICKDLIIDLLIPVAFEPNIFNTNLYSLLFFLIYILLICLCIAIILSGFYTKKWKKFSLGVLMVVGLISFFVYSGVRYANSWRHPALMINPPDAPCIHC